MIRSTILGLGCLLLALAATAQPTRMLEEFDFGEDSTVARMLFFERDVEEGKELCSVVGTRRGPRSLNKAHIFVTRRAVPREKEYNGRLKFKFKGKPEITENLEVWHACIPTPGPLEGAEEDILEVTVRGGQENNTQSRFYAPYPYQREIGTGVQIQFNNVGGLAGGFFEKRLDPKKPWDLTLDVPPAQE